jgi:hypothetical protein
MQRVTGIAGADTDDGDDTDDGTDDGDDTDEYLYKVLVVGEVRVRVWCIIGIYQAHPLVYS